MDCLKQSRNCSLIDKSNLHRMSNNLRLLITTFIVVISPSINSSSFDQSAIYFRSYSHYLYATRLVWSLSNCQQRQDHCLVSPPPPILMDLCAFKKELSWAKQACRDNPHRLLINCIPEYVATFDWTCQHSHLCTRPPINVRYPLERVRTSGAKMDIISSNYRFANLSRTLLQIPWRDYSSFRPADSITDRRLPVLLARLFLSLPRLASSIYGLVNSRSRWTFDSLCSQVSIQG